MLEYRKFIFERKDKEIQGTGSLIFTKLIQYNGSNLRDIIEEMKKSGIPNVLVRQSDLGLKRDDVHFIRLQKGMENEYVCLLEKDWVGIKPFEFYIISNDYVEKYYTVRKNKLVPKK